LIQEQYVLITAARNEEAYIEKTIQSVIGQTVRPKNWVIVSDGSTDRTDEIVTHYATEHAFIELRRIEDDQSRNFHSQVRAINVGYEILRQRKFEFVGNLDADVSFDQEYYEKVLERFHQNPRLGLAGGFIYERHNDRFMSRKFNSESSVAHAVQLFRRECFESFGGYVPLPYGGSDWVAEIMVRMNGWEDRAFPELKVFHYRPTASAGGIIKGSFRRGRMDYSLGVHPLFEFASCMRRVTGKPYLMGSIARFLGFLRGYFYRQNRAVSPDFIEYLREDQIRRLFNAQYLKSQLRIKKKS
jgi:poly-beta-1,6-N-acetyl-D-glucosamine synthase